MSIKLRAGGLLVHPTSLPGSYGIGDLGPSAHAFISWMREAGCRLWQVLPLGPTGYGNSPYQSHSVFAGNACLISPDLLERDGLLGLGVADSIWSGSLGGTPCADYEGELVRKMYAVRLIASRLRTLQPVLQQDFEEFEELNEWWLGDYSCFMAIKGSFGGQPWWQWPNELKFRRPTALTHANAKLADEILVHKVSQWLFFRQWMQVRAAAHAAGINIVGDAPIYAAHDSAEVWASPLLFGVDHALELTAQAGVPPDAFSSTGQLWGNPLYNWPAHAATGFSWWKSRIDHLFSLVDTVRLDHFCGVAQYWSVPAGAAEARLGEYLEGPGQALLDAILKGANSRSPGSWAFVAEDLGVVTNEVRLLRDNNHLPGMRVLQFGFTDLHSPYLPHNYHPECVAYTGTHDNDTARGWLSHASKAEGDFALRYLKCDAATISRAMLSAVWSSVARWAIAPMQDLLDLDSSSRMNTPGKAVGNWLWRMTPHQLSLAGAERLRALNDANHRC